MSLIEHLKFERLDKLEGGSILQVVFHRLCYLIGQIVNIFALSASLCVANFHFASVTCRRNVVQ